jgi:dienelactone hydrolase
MASDSVQMDIHQFQPGYDRELNIVTSRGRIETRYFRAEKSAAAALWVAGAIGGWHSPAMDLYPELSERLLKANISSLWIQYRQPNKLDECILDLLAGLAYLETEAVTSAALIGHSFGGAVVIQAAYVSEMVKTVITLATQSYGAEPVSELAPRCSLLLLHGTEDRILPPKTSEQVFGWANEPKSIRLYDGADHNLDEVADEVKSTVEDWILKELGRVKLVTGAVSS